MKKDTVIVATHNVTGNSHLLGKCESCKGDDELMYNDNGELLCEECMFEYESNESL